MENQPRSHARLRTSQFPLRFRGLYAAAMAAVLAAAAAAAGLLKAEEPDIRAGIIGLDTSHAPAFAALFNDPKNPEHVPGVRVVAAFPGGSPDLPQSADRVAGFTAQLRDRFQAEIVPDIAGLLSRVDAVLLLSVDGRPHLAQARAVIAAKKPLFIDKPLAASLADGREIVRLAREAKVPLFSGSALRFAPGIVKAPKDPVLGPVLGCEAFSPCPTEPHHPDLFWYGIHGVEILYAVMGPGCQSVTRTSTPDADLVVGRWRDGRLGTFRGVRRGAQPYGALVFGEKKVVQIDPEAGGSVYRPLLQEIARFFRTGVPPVSAEETLEVLAFMEAADLSKKEGGRPVNLAGSPER
jgi:predicted dehydrogenase